MQLIGVGAPQQHPAHRHPSPPNSSKLEMFQIIYMENTNYEDRKLIGGLGYSKI